MQFPFDPEFPEESRALIQAAEIRYGLAFEEAKGSARYLGVHDLLRTYILQMLVLFTREGSALVRQGVWDTARLESESKEFLRRFTISAQYTRAPEISSMVSNWDGSILYTVEREFRKSPLWQEYEAILLETATAIANRADAQNEANGTDSHQTPLGRNIDRLRKECGLSWDGLAAKTGLDKKLILGHTRQGKGAHPGTLRIYADTFTKLTQRRVTVAELEGQVIEASS